MKNKAFAGLILVSQFGITMIGSVLICVFAGIWIQRIFDTGYWVIIVGILLGVLSMFNSFYRLYRRNKKEETGKDDSPPGSNHHL